MSLPLIFLVRSLEASKKHNDTFLVKPFFPKPATYRPMSLSLSHPMRGQTYLPERKKPEKTDSF